MGIIGIICKGYFPTFVGIHCKSIGGDCCALPRGIQTMHLLAQTSQMPSYIELVELTPWALKIQGHGG
jgi:hypothetical protein